MKKVVKKIIGYIVMFAVLLVGTNLAYTYFTDHTIAFSVENLGVTVSLSFVIVAIFAVITLVGKIDKIGEGKSKAEDKATDMQGNKVSQFFDTDFVPESRLKSDKDFNYNNISSIRSSKKDGILVRAEQKGNNMDINFVQPIHTLIVGTTSSGKTTRFVVPSLQIMSMTSSKPSFVVTDPKGELHDLNANKLKKEGYEVYVVDFIKPFQSTRWNPLSGAFDNYNRSFHLEKEVRVHPPGDSPRKYNLMIQRDFDYTTTTWFEFEGTAYADKGMLENDMRIISRELRDEVYTDLQDISQAICPVQGDKDPSWQETAQKLLQAVMLAMLEDSQIPELKLTKDKFNFYNVAKIVNTQDSGRDTFATLKQYIFNYRDKFGQVAQLANTALNNADTTTKNYMGFATAAMTVFNDMGISFLTGDSELDFTNIDEKPSAIFLLIPDEIKTRYPLAILFVTQLYKRLVEKARKRGGKLKRNVYFMLDEFGNMPRFPGFGSSMAVGRSRGIFFELVVQSYSQLYQIYGQDEGKIIKDNCPIQVYIASEDMVTNKEFSELLGKKTIMLDNEQVSEGPDGKKSKSFSKQVQSIPIAYPEQLMKYRDKGEIIIKTFTPNAALKTKITPSYACKLYDNTPVFGSYVQRRTFDEQAIYYDIKQRNRVMAQKNGDDDDDDDLF